VDSNPRTGTYASEPLSSWPVRSDQWFQLIRGMRWSYESDPSGSDGTVLAGSAGWGGFQALARL